MTEQSEQREFQGELAHRVWQSIVVGPEAWRHERAYDYCPCCDAVQPRWVGAPPECSRCGQRNLDTIFTAMRRRLERAWDFCEATRLSPDRWLFRHSPDAADYSLWSTAVMALGCYAELRGLGIDAPWGNDEAVLRAWRKEIEAHLDPTTGLLRGTEEDEARASDLQKTDQYISNGYSRVLQKCKRVGLISADEKVYEIPIASSTRSDPLRSAEALAAYIESEREHWRTNPWSAGSWMWTVVTAHRSRRREAGLDPDDECVRRAHAWLDKKQDPATGAWGGEQAPHHVVVNGIFKVLSLYNDCGWPVRRQDQIVDFVLGGADRQRGFPGSGCTVFDPIMVLYVLRENGCSHRREEADLATARSCLTFLDNWDESINWYHGGNWNGKHNNGIPAFMAMLLLQRDTTERK